MDPKKQILNLISACETLRDGAVAAGRELSAAELETITANLAKVEELKSQVALLDKLSAASANIPKVAPAAAPSAGAARVPATSKPAWEDDPKRGFATAQDFFRATLNAAVTGQVPENLKFQAVSGDGHNTYEDSKGGFLVPKGFLPSVLQTETEADPVAGRTTMVPMGTPKLEIPARVDKDHSSSVSGGLRVFRRKEEATIQKSQMTLSKVCLEAHALFGLSYTTEELLSDSPISIAALLSAGFDDEFGSKVMSERLNGSGVGEFLGVHNSGALVTVAKESGQAADTINATNLIKMRARVWGYRNAVWMANHDTIPQLAALVDGSNRRIYHPSMQEDMPDMLLGRPIFFSEYMETVGDAGDIGCYNWTQYLEGTYQPLRDAESVHVRFSTHERAFKFWLRNAGTPWWSSALTPKKGANTLSPFVNLAARV